jgi:hypothetical protein
MSEKLNIYQKLLEVRKSVDYLKKESRGKQYNYTGSSQVLGSVRDKMNELGLLLEMKVTGHNLIQKENDKGTMVNTTELDLEMTWINVENPEEKIIIPWYAQGVDLAGEKGVGKAQTYGEKYFILKQFNIPTDKDDPDAYQEKTSNSKKTKPSKDPNPITQEKVGHLKTKVLEYCKLKNVTQEAFYQKIGLEDVTKLTEEQGNELLASLHKWIKESKEKTA